MSTASENKKLNMELLAPAGGMEQLRAAIYFGADAVYLAGNNFGMRAKASNFSNEELRAAVLFAHEHSVKVFVTANIVMHEADIKELPQYFSYLDEIEIDGLIVSDLGAFSVANKYAPHVPLHVSTQVSISNAESARAWYDLGAARIVCAREMSLADIKSMRKQIPEDLEIEVFAHGAMCMAVSGRCLISSYLTGRSGNKGECTQPCRWNYALEEEKRPGMYFPIEEDERGTYIMNACDLNMVEHLHELAEAGVNSIKIEGRNKKAFYVASVIGAYRSVLDGGNVEDAAQELRNVSHRPYSTGFFFGQAPQAQNFDGYEQETIHVADVLSCVKLKDEATAVNNNEPATQAKPAKYELRFRCRNKVVAGDVLEVLAPHMQAFEVTVTEISWLPENGGEVPVQEASRTCEIYTCTVDKEIPEHAYLRRKEYRRSARHA